jgi:hypothetical protein
VMLRARDNGADNSNGVMLDAVLCGGAKSHEWIFFFSYL